jgi:hypothetical protein
MSDPTKSIESIEEAYEYMLAYAAQGRVQEGVGPEGTSIRTFIDNFIIGNKALVRFVHDENSIPKALKDEFIASSVFISGVLDALKERENISSELVDNANALIGTRHYLTMMFFIDKAFINKA